jgi:DNA-binding PadR family transcriptional regulator
MNLTYPTTLVLQALASGYHHGFDIMDATGLPSGTVYPILRRLDREAMVRARWEKAEVAQREQRPPRRYYELTAAGERFLEAARDRYRAPSSIPARAGRRLRPARP